jgi:3-oxoacyl-[acyl-carrier-protein] synthase III
MLATAYEKEFRDQTAIAGIGYSRSPGVPGGFTRRSGMTVQTLVVRAALDACNDAGLDPKELDGGICYGLQDTVWPRNVLTALGVKNINWDATIEGGGNCSTACYLNALQAVRHGICNYVLA